MKAKDIVNKMLEAEADDPLQNIQRHGAEIYKERRFGGKLLATQPESAEPVAAIHFDLWNDDKDPDQQPWEWDSDQARNQLKLEVEELAKLPNMDTAKLAFVADLYPVSGDTHTFEMIADVLIDSGYSVYFSDLVFEVYRPEDITEEENVDDPEFRQ